MFYLCRFNFAAGVIVTLHVGLICVARSAE